MARKSNACVLAAISLLGLSGLPAQRAFAGPAPTIQSQQRDKTNWWSFSTPPKPPIPATGNAVTENPIDRFVFAKLARQNLRPSPEADRVTLIRRLTFDLTGLPPTPDEIADFISDRTPHAWDKVVDRLLSSPRYGERWARHWLDAVHYGETHGYDKDKPRLNAWPYRDYVIRAFNADKPYPRFVEEQLAGDVLFPDEPDAVAATGFIAAGPWDFVGHVELPISKSDGLIARYNDRDDMVMTTMSTFLSLTVHCARCHDHKFDPISQNEYYGLQAVFAGVDRADRPYDTDQHIWETRRRLVSEKRTLTRELYALNEKRARITSADIERLAVRVEQLKKQIASLRASPDASPGNGYHSAIEATDSVEKWVQADLGVPVAIDEIRLLPARPTDFPDTPGFGFPKRFRVDISEDESFKRPTTLIDQTSADYPGPGDKPLSIRPDNARARFVRVTATRLWERSHDYVFALAELEVYSGTTNVAWQAVVTALDSIEAGRWGKRMLVDGYDSRKLLHRAADAPELEGHGKELESELTQVDQERDSLIDRLMPPEQGSSRRQIIGRLAELGTELAKLPKPQQVYAAANDFERNGSFVPATQPRPVYLLARGDVKRPGELMTPGPLGSIAGLPSRFDLVSDDDEGSRRAALARWITDRRNLLTRRSIVNRIWHYHFGRGIVDTPNDFGHMGSLPTHPELLDWLAFWFLENGESLKKLHRLIVTSATYRQSSAANPAYARTDSGNRYLWRMNRTRLDAESLHDAMLFISGRLDSTMGGPSVQQFFFKDDHSPVYDYSRFKADDSGGNRRSIYRFIVRSVPDPLMDVLDCPDASLLAPVRNTTMTALQALATLNDPFVLQQAAHFARRVEPDGTLDRQIERAFLLALGRRPAAQESKQLARFAADHGMQNACRLIFNMNEFLFLD